MDLQTRDTATLRSLQQALKRWVDLFCSDPANHLLEIHDIIQEHLTDLRRVRWYSLNVEEVGRLWTNYVQDEDRPQEIREALLDFYLNGATFIWLETPVPSGHRDAFISHLIGTLTWVSRSTLIPSHIREYAVDAEMLGKILETNHWVLFMILMTVTDLSE